MTICAVTLTGSPGSAQADGLRVDTRAGPVSLAGGAITFDLPAGYRYAAGADARRVLEELWGNKGDAAVIGLVLPPEQAGAPPWSTIVSWYESGWVDDRPGLADADRQLADLRQHDSGGAPVEVVGWAEPPRYEADHKLLTWGARLRFAGDELESINLHHALLLRKGWLQLTTISPVPALDVLVRGATVLLPRLRVSPAHRHAGSPPDGGARRFTLNDIVTDRHSDAIAATTVSPPPADEPPVPTVATTTVVLLGILASIALVTRWRRRRPGSAS